MPLMTEDAHAQANAEQVRLLRKALAAHLLPRPETAAPEETPAGPETPAAACEASP